MHVVTSVIEEVVKTLQKVAMSSEAQLLADFATGHNPKTALKSRLKEVGKNTLRESVKKITRSMGGRIEPISIKEEH